MAYTSIKYAFTVTLQKKMYRETLDRQYDLTYLELAKRLRCLHSRFTLIAECTLNRNIHYHGMIEFNARSKDHILDFIDLFRKSEIFGFQNIKPISDEPGWIKYITEDVDESKILIGRPPVIIDDFSIYNPKGMDMQDIADLIDE